MVEQGEGHYEPREKQERVPSIVLHERAKALRAYDEVPERRCALLEAYFTTPASYNELRALVGDVSISAVHQQVVRGIRELRRGLPAEMREDFDMDKLERPKRPKQTRR